MDAIIDVNMDVIINVIIDVANRAEVDRRVL